VSTLAFVLVLFSILAYLWVSSYQLIFSLPLSPLLATTAVYLGLIIVFTKKKFRLTHTAQSLLSISIILVVWAAVVYFAVDAYPTCLHRLFQTLLSIAIAFTVYLLTTSENRIRIVVYFLIFGATVSAIVGIGQFFIGEPFISFWLASGEVSGKALDSVLGGRIAGLSNYAVPLSYQLCSIIPLGVALFAFRKKRLGRLQALLLIIAIFIILMALSLTLVRSSILGVFIGSSVVLFMKFQGKRRSGYLLISGVIVGLLLYGIFGYFLQPQRFIGLSDVSARSRVPMQLTAINYSLKHPLGTGSYKVSKSYAPSFVEKESVIKEQIITHTSHNQFLNVLTYYGFPGLFLLIAFYRILYKGIKKQWEFINLNEKYQFEWIVAGLAGTFISYLINSWFHNAGLFVGDVFHWYFIGMFFATGRLLIQEKNYDFRI